MRQMPKHRFTPATLLRTLAWGLLAAIVITNADSSQAADTSTTRPGPQARAAPQPGNAARPQEVPREVLGAGDSIRVTVFQNADLTTETRISQTGSITFPLVGEVALGGLTPSQAGSRIAEQLKRGNFIVNPQVSVAVVQVRSRQVYALGQLTRPGNYVLDDTGSRLTDILTLAGGINPNGADRITVLSENGGKTVKREIDVPAIFRDGDPSSNIQLQNNDIIFVERAPVFYIYGEIQRAGAYRLEPGMIVMQAMSLGGGLTPRGTERGIGIHRRQPNGQFARIAASLTDQIRADDIVFVKESLF
jgi:polysaccharide biosynthesis/export protein